MTSIGRDVPRSRRGREETEQLVHADDEQPRDQRAARSASALLAASACLLVTFLATTSFIKDALMIDDGFVSSLAVNANETSRSVKFVAEMDSDACPAASSCSMSYPVAFLESSKYYSAYLEEVTRTRLNSSLRLLPSRFLVFEPRAAGQPAMVYCHIHKNGGSSLNSKSLLKNGTFPYRRVSWYARQENKFGSDRFKAGVDETRERLFNSSTFFFSFLRDPVTRFFAAIEQVRSNGHFDETFPECGVHGDFDRQIECVLHRLQSAQSFLNPHLQPQVFELNACLGSDLGLVVADLKHMNAFMSGLGAPGSLTHENHKSHAWSASLNITNAICQLYAVDVELLDLLMGPARVESPCQRRKESFLFVASVGSLFRVRRMLRKILGNHAASTSSSRVATFRRYLSNKLL